MKVCTKCNAEIKTDGKFCQNCGTPVDVSPTISAPDNQPNKGSYTQPVQAVSGTQPNYTMQQNAGVQMQHPQKPGTSKKTLLIIGIIGIILVLIVVGGLVLKSVLGKFLQSKILSDVGNPVTDEGYYDLISMEEDGEIITSDEFLDHGFEGGYIKFYSDGTIDMHFFELERGIWVITKDGIIIDENDDITMILDDDLLIVDMYGDEYIYSYVKGKTPKYSTNMQNDGKPVTDIGYYDLISLEEEGEVITSDRFEDYGFYGGYIKFYSDGIFEIDFFDFETGTWSMTEKGITIDESEGITMTLHGDILTVDMYGEECIYTYVKGEVPYYPSNTNNSGELDNVPLQDTIWYGWIQYSNVWGDAPEKEDAIYDVWVEIGQNSDGGEYFDAYQIDIERPVISFWVDIYDNYLIPILAEGWVLEHELIEADVEPLTLYGYEDTLSVYYIYESDDGKWGCDLSLYTRILGNPWYDWETLPPNYEEFKNLSLE